MYQYGPARSSAHLRYGCMRGDGQRVKQTLVSQSELRHAPGSREGARRGMLRLAALAGYSPTRPKPDLLHNYACSSSGGNSAGRVSASQRSVTLPLTPLPCAAESKLWVIASEADAVERAATWSAAPLGGPARRVPGNRRFQRWTPWRRKRRPARISHQPRTRRGAAGSRPSRGLETSSQKPNACFAAGLAVRGDGRRPYCRCD